MLAKNQINLKIYPKKVDIPVADYENVVGQDSINRFDSQGKRPKSRKKNKKGKNLRRKNLNQKQQSKA